MRKLVFKEVSILSKVEKTARREKFGPTINLLTGENDVGKSTLIKCLSHTLGADTPGLQNARWKGARPIYCLRFALDGAEFSVLRDEKYFGVFDASDQLLGRFVGISGDRGIAHFLNPLLNFRIELERADDGQLGLAGPAFYFLPFYVDQDEGWAKSWASFNGLQQFSSYRKNMLEYHLGVRPQRYYDAKKKFLELSDNKGKLEEERAALSSVRDSYVKKKSARQIDIDPAIFRREIEELVELQNRVYVRQQHVVQELKDIRNERHALENEIIVLQRAIRELDADYELAENPETPDIVACPTCGTEIANSIVERFGILDDIDYCNNLINQRQKRIVDVSMQEEIINSNYRDVTAELTPIESLLKHTREKVSFAEFVAAEGMKDIMGSLSEDINGLMEREEILRKEIDRLQGDLRVDAKLKRKINAFYQSRMKEFLSVLNVHVLSESDYKSFEKQIKTNALGSDLPRSLLAQYFAFLHTMKAFNASITCPLVLDSPLQQEQDTDNIAAIFSFIFERVLPGQQLILGTLSLNDDHGGVPESAHKIHLTDELHLLQKDQYASVMERIGKMHELTLAVE
jgi:energy-coupling factor transporter ATP-binding protein EcfA2